MPEIAYLTGTFPSWSETFVEQEIRLLREAGVPIVPVAIRPGGKPIDFDIPAPHYLGEVPSEMGSAASSYFVRGAVRRIGSLFRHGNELASLRLFLRSRGIRHVHAAFVDLPGLLAAAAAERDGLTYSLSVHAQDAVSAKFDDAFIFENAKFVSACNRRVLRLLQDRYPPVAPKLHLIHHGLDLELFRRRRPAWQPGEPLRFLFVGRLVKKKQPVQALHLVRQLNRQKLPAELAIVGEGPERAEMERLVADDALAGNIRWLGVLARPDVADAMAQADFLLLPSREVPAQDMEGIPNVIVEAMAVGLPVLTSLTGSIDEVINEQTGWAIDPQNLDQFTDLVRQLCANPAAVQARVVAARRLVEEQFDAQCCIKKTAALFRSICG